MNGNDTTNDINSENQTPKDLNEMIENLEEEIETEENYIENMKNVYKIAFEEFDTEKNNYLSTEQLMDVMKSLGYDLSKNEIEDMMFSVLKKEKVKNYDKINLTQFQKLMNVWRPERDIVDEYIEAFRVFDQTGNGKIPISVLEKVLFQYGTDITHKEIKYMLNDANVNNDGLIDYRQFVRLLLNK